MAKEKAKRILIVEIYDSKLIVKEPIGDGVYTKLPIEFSDSFKDVNMPAAVGIALTDYLAQYNAD